MLKTKKEKNLKRTQGKKDILHAEKRRLRMTATIQIRRRLSSIQSVILESHTYQKLSKRKMKFFKKIKADTIHRHALQKFKGSS